MDFSPYLLTWAGYLVGALGCLLVWLRMTRNLGWAGTRRFLQLAAAALLLTPWTVASERSELAPALMVALFDSLQLGPQAFWRAGIALLWALVLAGGLTACYQALIALGRRGQPEAAASQRQEPHADV